MDGDVAMEKFRKNGVDIAYEVRGSGIPLVFVHPPVISSISFRPQMQDLERDFTAVRFDIRGHGQSSESREPLTYALISDDIVGLLDHLQISKAFVCGYSMGGSVALEFLLRHPDRALGAVVIGGVSEVHDVRLAIRMRIGAIITGMGLVSPFTWLLAKGNSGDTHTLWDTYQESKGGNPQNMKQYYRYGLKYRCTDRLAAITLPALLVYGAKDKGFHSYAYLLEKSLSNTRLVFIENMGHAIPGKASDVLHTHIREFVDESQGKTTLPGNLPSPLEGFPSSTN